MTVKIQSSGVIILEDFFVSDVYVVRCVIQHFVDSQFQCNSYNFTQIYMHFYLFANINTTPVGKLISFEDYHKWMLIVQPS